MNQISDTTARLYDRAIGAHDTTIEWKDQDGRRRYRVTCSCGERRPFNLDPEKVAMQIKDHQLVMAFYANQARERGHGA